MEIEKELSAELSKLTDKHRVPCHKYILITNVPFSGQRHVGTRDRVKKVIDRHRVRIPEIEVWDAVDLSRMLDADPGVRTSYLEDVLPGDVLRSMLSAINATADRRRVAMHAYLKSLLNSERDAKAEEAGDESGLHLDRIFVDLNLHLVADNRSTTPLTPTGSIVETHVDAVEHPLLEARQPVPASFAIFRAGHHSLLLKGGPGVGKSTITQFMTLYQAARLVAPTLAIRLVERLKLPDGMSPQAQDAYPAIRLPFRIELRRYAEWIADPKRANSDTFLAQYIAERINRASSSTLDMDDVFAIVSKNPILLILDGLDEVPNPTARDNIFQELRAFLNRCDGEECDVQLVLSSRPQGYRGEFDGFKPTEWHVADLDLSDFTDYRDRWLNERVHDSDERRDAIARIEAGMRSSAVQQMAKTLLQATVMLIIARRKHSIPHARHKLFEKYVEVIFEREKNKQTVRERERELHRLHELVGYELIKKMEAAEGKRTLDGDDFKRCVQQVIEDYGPSDLRQSSIGRVVREIVTLAKDRLCLLAGKGDEQEDIDFVIQPFREYFAAAHLAHHEEADPDKVYQALVERRHIWGNVLQFYAAFQTKAQQNNWISEADGTNVSQLTIDGLVHITRNRRALLRILPEFERPKNEYVRRAIRNLFDEPTRWGWATRTETASLLRAFAHNDCFSPLKEEFRRLNHGDLTRLHAELSLLSACAGKSDNIRDLIQECINDPETRRIAVDVAHENGIKVDTSNVPLEDLAFALRFRPRTTEVNRSRFTRSLKDNQVVDLQFSNVGSTILFPVGTRKNSERKTIKKLHDVLSANGPSIQIRNFAFSLAPSFVDRRNRLPTHAAEWLENSGSHIGPYLAALVRSIDRPSDLQTFEKAAEIEKRDGSIIPDNLKLVRQLGAHPSSFGSPEAWTKTRASIRSASTLAKGWLSSLSIDDGSWSTLFVRPDLWDEMSGVIESRVLVRISGKYQAQLASISPYSAFALTPHQVGPQTHIPNLVEFCRRAMSLLGKYGRGSICNDRPAISLLSGIFSNHIANTDASSLLEEASVAQDIPPAWSGLVISLCTQATDINAGSLLSFWMKNRTDETGWPLKSRPLNEALVSSLLSMKSDDAVTLAAFVIASQVRHHGERVLSPLMVRVSQLLCEVILRSSGAFMDLAIRLLLQLPPSTSEVSVWSPETLRSLNAWDVTRVANRLHNISVQRHGYTGALRTDFARIIERRTEYPMEIPLAALDCLLRMGELSSAPIRDRDWKREKR